LIDEHEGSSNQTKINENNTSDESKNSDKENSNIRINQNKTNI